MRVSAITNYPAYKSVLQENRKPPVEQEVPSEPMMQPHYRPKAINPVSLTGWIGAASVVTAIATGAKPVTALHKIAAFAGVAAIAAHIGMVNARHHFFHSQEKQG